MLSEGPGRYRRRLHPIPGLPAVVRYDLRGVMGYDGAARRDSAWSPSLDASGLTSADVPMIRRILRVSDRKIRRAVRLADLPDDQAAELHGTLIARREALRARLQRLTGR